MNTHCEAIQYSDEMQCARCGLAWEVNDPEPPECTPQTLVEFVEFEAAIVDSVADAFDVPREDLLAPRCASDVHALSPAQRILDNLFSSSTVRTPNQKGQTMKTSLLIKIRGMSDETKYQLIYTDHLTGLLNRRAFDFGDGLTRFVAIVDLDSLKYINDTFGHRQGDAQLTTMAAHLKTKFGGENTYRLSGDEFAVVSDYAHTLVRGLRGLRLVLPGFSFGVGINLVRADELLRQEKAQREQTGARAPRGKRPEWAGRLPLNAVS